MSVSMLPPVPSDEEVAAAQEATQLWNGGNQSAALERIRPFAARPKDWAVGLSVWMLMQQGPPAFPRAMELARTARELGMPWVPVMLFNQMIGHAPADPAVLDWCLELAGSGAPAAVGIDPISHGWNLLNQGQAAVALRLMNSTVIWPESPQAWDSLVQSARGHLDSIAAARSTGEQLRDEFGQLVADSSARIDGARARLETEARQAGLLVTRVNSATANALYEDEATQNEKESRAAWRWGLLVLVAAAGLALAPLVDSYLGWGPRLAGGRLLAAHAGSTAALGTVAGVLLARARGRDRARQRARDLATAMGTMITYSNQIQDDAEKQRFMLTMGQLVLQAHLRADAPVREDAAGAGLTSLVSALRPSAAG